MSVPEEAPASPAEIEEFAIVEIFGHRRHAGRIIEVDRFGTKLLRIDIPTDGDFAKGFVSQFYGGASIFSMTPTDRATAEQFNKRDGIAPRPLLTSSSIEDYDEPF